MACSKRTICHVLACLAATAVTSEAGFAGAFTVLVADTSLSDTLGSEVVYDLKVANTSGRALTLGMVRALNDLPEGWQSSLCIDLCYSPFLDSVATTADFGSSPVRAGDTAAVSVHVFPLTNPGRGVIRVVVMDVSNPSDRQEFRFTTDATATTVQQAEGTVRGFALDQNYPNPWNPATAIRYRVAGEGRVSLRLYDALGREVKVLVDERQQAGEHTVELDGSGLASGVYLYRLVSGSRVQARSMILVK